MVPKVQIDWVIIAAIVLLLIGIAVAIFSSSEELSPFIYELF